MLHDIVRKGSTDRSVTLRIIDSADGTPETGVVFNTGGIDLWYRREGAAKVSITEVTLAALTTAHTDGGFLHIGDGYYRLDLPDAAYATGVNHFDFGGTVTGMVVIGGRVRLIDISLEDTVRAGLTALPNVATDAAGGLTDLLRALGHRTTIASLASQTSFTLTAGSADNDAYNGWGALIYDASSGVQLAFGVVSDYVGSTKTITLESDPGVFTMATGDSIYLIPAKLTDSVLNEAVEGAFTLKDVIRLYNAALLGKASGLGTSTAIYRDLADTKPRITATVDSVGNRTAVTRDAT